MPYTEKQHRVFQAIAHGWKPNKGSLASISQSEAKKMAGEGVKGGLDGEIGRTVKKMRARHRIARRLRRK